jgi:hypothetical protein
MMESDEESEGLGQKREREREREGEGGGEREREGEGEGGREEGSPRSFLKSLDGQKIESKLKEEERGNGGRF